MANEAEESETVRLQSVDGAPSANKLGPTDDGYDPHDHRQVPNATKLGPTDDDYDPHEHRDVPNATNNIETLIHLLKCSLGTGILAMPQAFARAGLITGFVATIIIGTIITHCLHVLVGSQYVLCKKQRVPLLTYPESMTAALEIGPPTLKKCMHGPAVIVDFFLVVYQLGICCVYIVFISSNLKQIFDAYYMMSIEKYMLIILVPLIGINCIRNLKALAPWSTLANLLTLIGLGIIVYLLLAGMKWGQPLDMWGSIDEFPMFFGTTLFALTAVGVVLSLENNMKTPKAFGKPCGVLNMGMSFIVLLYVLVGALGYMYCSVDCGDSITMDLPEGPVTTTMLVMYSVAIFISYALQCYVPVKVLWDSYLQPRLERSGSQHMLLWEYGLRVLLCLITFLLAISVPELGLFISLFGALCLSALGLIFPAFMEICVSYPDKFGLWRNTLIKDIFLILIGTVGMIAGTYATMVAMIKTFQ